MKTISIKANSRKGLLLILLIGLIINLNAQTDQQKNLPQFLNPGFVKSRIAMKTGKDIYMMLNYNLVTERMIFLQKEKVYDMIKYDAIDTIYMNGGMFVPNGKVFYEVFQGPRLTFYIQHRGSLLSAPKPAAFGGTSEVNASSYISRIDLGASMVYNMKLNEEIRVKYSPLYWVSVNNIMYCFTGERQLLKIFTGKEDLIKQYIKNNGLKFENRGDLIKIWKYCNEIAD
jgi:hypothetical protein